MPPSDGGKLPDGGGADRPGSPLDMRGALRDGALPDLAQPMIGGDDLSMPAIVDSAVVAPPDQTMLPDQTMPPDLAAPPPPPDMAPMCVPQTQPCDVICQNCGVNLKCGANGMGAPVCLAAGNVITGQPCGANGADDCIAHDVCIRESTALKLNLCIEFCRVDGDCKNGGKCVYTLTGGTLKVCSDRVNNCEPVLQQGCNAGACYVVTPDGQTGCHQAGGGTMCGACDTDYDCAPGFACFGASNSCFAGGCAQLCHKGNNFDCPLGLTCRNVTYNAQMQQWANWGICDL